MPLRLMQIFVPETTDGELDSLLEDLDVIGRWRDETESGRIVLNAVVEAEQTEPVMDRLENAFGDRGELRVVLYAVEAVLPRPEEEQPESEPESTAEAVEQEAEHAAKSAARVSREELYNDVTESLGVNRVFLAMTFLSSVVAAVGLLRDDTAVIIGAMVIAPLLGPNVAMAFATTLGDVGLLRRAFVSNIAGVGLAFAVAALIGVVFRVDADVAAIAARTHVGVTDILLALAAGSAGTFAFTRGMSNAVIGVMVAVALMPPLVAFGMLLGDANFPAAFGAMVLTAVNVICINLAGVATFAAQGVRPRSWYEEARAKKARRIAILIWAILLAILAAILAFTGVGR
jgi:uncharacterized hydrophobic protein (TIGR00341 family)